MIGCLKEGLPEIVRRSTLATYKFFSQLNLSWLTSILVPPRGPGKDLVADALSRPTTRAHGCERRENNFCQLHTSWLTSLGLSALVRGSDVSGCILIPNRLPRKAISPIAYFQAIAFSKAADVGLVLKRRIYLRCCFRLVEPSPDVQKNQCLNRRSRASLCQPPLCLRKKNRQTQSSPLPGSFRGPTRPARPLVHKLLL